MNINSFLKINQHKVRHSSEFNIENGTVTLADQEDALKTPWKTYRFIKQNISGTNIEKCHKSICKNPYITYLFAKHSSKANVEYCQKFACKQPEYAFWFAKDIPGADIEYCRKACENDEYLENEFNKKFPRKQSK